MVNAPLTLKSTKPGTLLGGRSRSNAAVSTNCDDEFAIMRDFGEWKLDEISQSAIEMTPDRPFSSDAANNYYHAMVARKLAAKQKGRDGNDSTEKSLEDMVAHALTVAKTPEDVARYLLLNNAKNAPKVQQTVPPVSSFENCNDNQSTISAITHDVLSARSPGGPVTAICVRSSACSVATEMKSVIEEDEYDPPIESYPSPVCSPEDDTPGDPETNARAKVSPLPYKLRLPDDAMGDEKYKCNSNDDSTAASTNPSEDESNEVGTANDKPKETIEPRRNSLTSNIKAAITGLRPSSSKDQPTQTSAIKSKPSSGDGFVDQESHEKALTLLGDNAYEVCEAIAKGVGKMNQSHRLDEIDNISVAYSATDALSSTGLPSMKNGDGSVDCAKNKSSSLSEETSKRSSKLSSIGPFFNGRSKVTAEKAVTIPLPPSSSNLSRSKSSIAEDHSSDEVVSNVTENIDAPDDEAAADASVSSRMSAPSTRSKKSVRSDTGPRSLSQSKSPIAKLKKTLSLSISKDSRDDSTTKKVLKVAAKESRGKPSQRSKSSQLPPRVPVKGKKDSEGSAESAVKTSSNDDGSIECSVGSAGAKKNCGGLSNQGTSASKGSVAPSSLTYMTGMSRRAESPACSVECSLKSKDGSVESKVLAAVAKIERKDDQSKAVEAPSIDAPKCDYDTSTLQPRVESVENDAPPGDKFKQGSSLTAETTVSVKPPKEEKSKTATLKERKDKLKRILTYRKKTNSSPTSQAVDSAATTELVNKTTFDIGSKSATESNYQAIGSANTADAADDVVDLDKPDTSVQSVASHGIKKNRSMRSANKSLPSSRRQTSNQSSDDGSNRDTVTSLPGQNAENLYKSSAPLGSIDIGNRHSSFDAVSLPQELKHSKVQIWQEPADIDLSDDEGDIRDGEGNLCHDGYCQADDEKGEHCKGGSRFACGAGGSLMSEVKGALSDVKNGVKLFQSKLFGACDMTDENGVEVFMDTVADAVISAEEKVFGMDDEGTLMITVCQSTGQSKEELSTQKIKTTEPKWVKSKKEMTAKDMMIANAIELEANEVVGVVNDASEHESHVSYLSEQQSLTVDGFVAQIAEEQSEVEEKTVGEVKGEQKKIKYLSKLRAISLKHL